MIALLRGEVVVRRPDHVILLCDGVGYRVAVSSQTLARVPAAGEQASLHTHMIVRDDALALYGFAAEHERDLFLMLLAVQAVGPKVAIAVLSDGTPAELMAAIAAGDSKRFQAVPGIGKRTAERIIVELREKVPAVTVEESLDPDHPGPREIVARRGDSARMLAREGLVELGFTAVEAEELLGEVRGDTAERLIAEALRLSRQAREPR